LPLHIAINKKKPNLKIINQLLKKWSNDNMTNYLYTIKYS
jgi:DNA replication protein DnaD